jgi:hypothetical protein
LRHEAEQVAERADAELREPLGDFRADAREAFDGPLERGCVLRLDARVPGG